MLCIPSEAQASIENVLLDFAGASTHTCSQRTLNKSRSELFDQPGCYSPKRHACYNVHYISVLQVFSTGRSHMQLSSAAVHYQNLL